VIGGALRNGVAGRPDDGALARLNRQVEIVRDAYAGLIVGLRGFVITVVGVTAGLLSVAPIVLLLLLPPFLLGFAASLTTLRPAASRVRASLHADERLATTASTVLAATRDVAARGTEQQAAELVAEPVEEQADAERALARVTALRTLCFAVGGWLPLMVLLAAGPWLLGRGLTAGAIMAGLTYVLVGLQPALASVMGTLGSSGLRFVVTLGRILDAGTPPPQPAPPSRPRVAVGRELSLQDVTFAYGPHAEPVLEHLDLAVPDGDHLAVVGPSGIGKSTLAGLVCGLLRPDRGSVQLGGVPTVELPAEHRVLIPQEAYVFSGTVLENVSYLRPAATDCQVEQAITAVGAESLLSAPGGLDRRVRPGQLSAGERQLLALVRAYLSTAPLVVLDEATCHLDPVGEARAETAFAEREGTLIVIAHRVSSALRARRVLVLDGTRAALGDHETLLEVSPLYRDLLGHWSLPTPDQIQPAS
jgi:ATP-binding cassette, subfamily C, bacterial